MSRSLKFGGLLALLVTAGAVAETGALADQNVPTMFVTLNQNIDQGTLNRYHHTDQGTRLAPAAWLVALEKVDGSGKFMTPENLKRYGWLVENVTVDAQNPYGWPIGWLVSNQKVRSGIPSGGYTCAACHTGQINYKGASIRIEGGQGMENFDQFLDHLGKAFKATAADPARRARFMADAVKAGYPADRIEADFAAAAPNLSSLAAVVPGLANTDAGPGRSDSGQGIGNRLFGGWLREPANLRPMDGPVSVPYLWDIWRLSWVQTNGFQPGADHTARNIGEAVANFGETNIFDSTTGALNPEPLRWKTNVRLDNLIWMEETLRGLHAPMWPEPLLGTIDQTKATRGKQLFTSNCAGCHGIKELPNGAWDVVSVSLEKIGTDPNMTTNWAGRTYDATKLGLGKEVFVWDALPAVVVQMRKQLYEEYDIPPAKQDPDFTHANPCSYKARPLIGTWATPPFLHNGSVPTIFDLLSDARPAKFTIGTREFDPVRLGYVEAKGQEVFVFDTTINGNSNAGHWFTDESVRPGRIGPKLSDSDKYDIIEYLKAATYENYPSEKRAEMELMPCYDDRTWALKK